MPKLLFMKIALAISFMPPRGLATEVSSACAHNDTTFKCVRYIANYDGDTITFDIPNVHPFLGKSAKVRVNGVDTPEIKGGGECESAAARIAKRLVESELKNAKQIDLMDIRKDKYFRILADVQYDGINLREVLFKNKLAVPYGGETKRANDWCTPLRKSQ